MKAMMINFIVVFKWKETTYEYNYNSIINNFRLFIYFDIVLIVCVLNKLDEDTILSFVCGPVFWLFLIPAYLEDCFKSIKDKKYIYSEETYQRFLKMNWKMHRFGNVLLIKNRNSKFSLWGVRIIKNIDEPAEAPIDINELRRKEIMMKILFQKILMKRKIISDNSDNSDNF